MKTKTALVTGASSGVGKATAERLAMAGYNVYETSSHPLPIIDDARHQENLVRRRQDHNPA